MTSPSCSPEAFHVRAVCQEGALLQRPHVVGFCGPAGVGKTTAACLLVDDMREFHRISFADPLRQMLIAFGLTSTELSRDKEVPHPLLCGKTPRFAMRTLGTEWARESIGDDIWIRAANRRVQEIWAIGGRVVFDDVRFENEAHLIHGLGGIVIELSRPGSAYMKGHASERGVSGHLVDFRVESSSLVELSTKLRAIFNAFSP